jgi:hypothetical protein
MNERCDGLDSLTPSLLRVGMNTVIIASEDDDRRWRRIFILRGIWKRTTKQHDYSMQSSESTKPVTWTLLLMAAALAPSTAPAAAGKSKKKKAPQPAKPAPAAPQQRHTVQLSSGASIAELCTLASDTIGSHGGIADNAQVVITITSLKTGFPPRPLDLNVRDSVSLAEAGLHDKDRILVDYSVGSHDEKDSDKEKDSKKRVSSPKAKPKPKPKPANTAATTKPKRKAPAKKSQKTAFAASDDDDDEHDEHLYDDDDEQGTAGTVHPQPTTSSSSPTATPARPRSKRAAAVQATEAFPEVLKAQDALMQQQQSPKKRTRSAAAGSVKPTASSSPAKLKPKKATKFTAAATEGRKLQDGSVVAPKVPSRRRARPGNGSANGNDEDPGVALLGSLQASNQAGRLMRKNWKQAVNSSYEQNQAVARLAAVSSAKVTFVRVHRDGTPFNDHDNMDDNENDDVDNTDCSLQVTYPKGIQGRGDYVDTVDYLPVQVLKSVVAAIHPADALRQENLALLSPRVFWSVLYHSHQNQRGTTGTASTAAGAVSVHAALQALQPDLDWTFLRRRKEQLSAKARENMRQEQEKSDAASGAAHDYEAAAAAIESVEQAMGALTAHDRSQRQARVRAAALRRLQGSAITADDDAQEEDVWQIVTPEEEDYDELMECVCNTAVEGSTAAFGGQQPDTLVRAMMQQHQIPNWRVLANANAAELAISLQSTVNSVTGWIVRAQQESVDEIIVEICQGNVDAVTLLQDGARSGTPKDLAAWRWIVDSLHEELVSYQDQKQQKSGEETAIAVPDAATLQLWCDRAQLALEQIEWLSWYVTPISD